MAKLSREDVLKLARLAHIEITEDEIDEFSKELSNILDYVELLGGIDVGGLKPTNQVTGLTNVTRPDQIKSYGYSPDDLLKLAPKLKDRQIQVKRILT